MEVLLRLKLVNQLKSLGHYLGGIILNQVFLFTVNYDRSFVIISMWIIAVQGILVLFLYFEYIFFSLKKEIKINGSEIVVYRSKKIVSRFVLDDVEKIILYKSRNIDRSGIQLLSHESFYYCKLIRKRGGDLLINNLMSSNLHKIIDALEGAKIIRKPRLFCSMIINVI